MARQMESSCPSYLASKNFHFAAATSGRPAGLRIRPSSPGSVGRDHWQAEGTEMKE